VAIQWTWKKDDGWEWVGRKNTGAEYASMKQVGDTCWATCMAMACAMLIGDPKERMVLKDTERPSWWVKYAKDVTSGVDGKEKIASAWFISMAETMNEDPEVPVTCSVYDPDGMPMEKIAGVLRTGGIVLLHSSSHVVVLSALAVDSDRNLKFRITDPATGEYLGWAQKDLDAYKYKVVSIVRKKTS
jgi:hypothetical protein